MDVTVTIRPAAAANREDGRWGGFDSWNLINQTKHITLLVHTLEVAGISGVEELPGRTQHAVCNADYSAGGSLSRLSVNYPDCR